MRPAGGWKFVRDVEIAVAKYIDWFNDRRLHGEIGHVPPAEFQTNHCSLGKSLTKDQTTRVHRENSGENYGYLGMIEAAIRMFGK